jgi:hypothetical protein
MLTENTIKNVHINSNNNLTGNNYETSNVSRGIQQQPIIKDEFQTVPEHPNTMTKTTKNNTKRKTNSNSNNTNNNNTINKRLKAEKSLSVGSADTSADSLNVGSIGKSRRDTDNSSIDSHSLDYSPIDIVAQSSVKQEIKRARNREAARKCRTRKLEKIANLEIQVKKLSTENEIEKAKNDRLADEINEIRQRLEMHQKIHNCDLKIM